MRLWAIAWKELLLLWRDPGGLIMLFVLPAVFIVVLSVSLQGAFASGHSRERFDVLLVDEEKLSLGELLAEALSDSGRFRPIEILDGRPLDRDRAIEALGAGRHQVAVVVPAGSSRAAGFRADASIEVLVDPALSEEFAVAVTGLIRTVAQGFALEGLKRVVNLSPLAELVFDGYVGDRCLQVRQAFVGPPGAELRPNSVQQSVPGWTIFALFWISQILAINLIQERLSGAWRRILVSPVSLAAFLAGKMLPFFAINLLQAAIMFAIGVWLLPHLGAPGLTLGEPLALIAMTAAISIASLGFGLMMAALSRTVFLVASLSAALMIIMAILGGIMVPKFVMPALMQRASLWVPHGWALDGYLDILVRGADLARAWPSILAVLAFGLGFHALAWARLARQSPRPPG
jgi:ABC-2 type transport system permease protein